MVAIKSLAQLSLSRPTSQNSSPRSMTPSSSPPAANPSMNSRPACNEDYYLSDEQLVTHRLNTRTKSSGSIPRKGDLNISITSPPTLKLTWTSSHEETPAAVLPPLKPSPLTPMARGPRQQMLMTPAPTVACGHMIQPTPHTSGAHRPLLSTLLSVSTKASPNLSRAASPFGGSIPASPNPAGVGPSPLHQDGRTPLQQLEASYVSKVSGRLRDLVNKVFPSTVENGLAWVGRAAPRPAIALELGEALKHELTVSSCDSYILRALLRTAVIPALTIYLGRLDPLLVPVSSEAMVLFVPKTSKEVDHSLPLVLRYNIEVIKSAWAVRSSVDEICSGNAWDGEVPKALTDGLVPFASKLDAIVQRLMGPYVSEIKNQVMARIIKFRMVDPTGVHSSVKVLPPTLNRSTGHGVLSASWGATVHPTDLMTELGMMLEGVRKLLMVKIACGSESKKWMVSVASQAVWKGMLAFAARPATSLRRPTLLPPPSSLQYLDAATLGFRGARHILRGGGKRSPSPPATPEYMFYSELTTEVTAFSVLINQFVKDIAGLGQINNAGIPVRPDGPDCVLCRHGFLVNPGDDGDLVRDAMNEALEALSAFQLVLLGLLHPAKLMTCLKAAVCGGSPIYTDQQQGDGRQDVHGRGGDVGGTSVCETLTKALVELPPLILLHLLTSRISPSSGFRLPHEIWGESWNVYEAELKGFVAAEGWSPEIAEEVMREVRRLRKKQARLEETKSGSTNEKVDGDGGSSSNVDEVGLSGHDLEMFGLLEFVCQFQIGIKV